MIPAISSAPLQNSVVVPPTVSLIYFARLPRFWPGESGGACWACHQSRGCDSDFRIGHPVASPPDYAEAAVAPHAIVAAAISAVAFRRLTLAIMNVSPKPSVGWDHT
jgi:hypothetical protein